MIRGGGSNEKGVPWFVSIFLAAELEAETAGEGEEAFKRGGNCARPGARRGRTPTTEDGRQRFILYNYR